MAQPLQLEYKWSYLMLVVDPLAGELKWRWMGRMRAADILPVLKEWALDVVVWDGAPAHKAKSLAELGTHRVMLPPRSPELNPAERVFEEARRHVEGKVYEDLQAKRKAVDDYLDGLKAEPDRVRSICGWEWIERALANPAKVT